MTPKRFVTIIAAAMVLCSITVIVTYNFSIGHHKLPVQAIRLVLTCLLAVSLIRGWTPGRWIAVILFGLAGVGSLLGGLGVIARSLNGIWLLAIGAIYSACIVGLLTPLAGKHFCAEPSASPNGDPARHSDNSGVTEEPTR